jgi:signal transduction histidine kinase
MASADNTPGVGADDESKDPDEVRAEMRADAPGGSGEVRDSADDSRLLDAILSVASEIDLPGVLRRIIAAACHLTDARYGALGVVDERGETFTQFITQGLTAEHEALIGERPTGKGVLGLLLSDPRPLRLEEIGSHPRSFGFPVDHPPMTSFLGAPIRVRGLVYGNLYLTDKQTADEFSERDEHLVTSLAAAAGVAIDNARLHERLAEMALYADRERIARDLHDTVIQRLFAIGLVLQGLSHLVDPPEAGQRIDAAVDDIDATIADIRTTIFALQGRALSGLRAEIVRVLTELREPLGFLPKVQFDGPVDAVVSDEVRDHTVAMVLEALTNVLRHARATRAEVSIVASDGELRVRVSDDGVGIRSSSGPGGNGLRNMAERAQELSGSLDVRSPPGEGTSITWRVPLKP